MSRIGLENNVYQFWQKVEDRKNRKGFKNVYEPELLS